jgi:hypothetical protein
MGQLSIDQQIDMLRPGIACGFARAMMYWFVGGAAALAILSSNDGILIPRGNPKPPKEVRCDD